jgi:phage shock protein E
MRRTLLLLLLPLLACSPQRETQVLEEREPAPPTAATATPQSLEPLYLDVRSPEEFATGHVVGAVNIPHTEMAERWTEIAEHRDRPVVLYCRTGRRSAAAQQVLQERGFTNMTNARTLEALSAQGVPTTR